MRTILHIIPVKAPRERINRVRGYLVSLAHPGTRVEVMHLPDGPEDLEYYLDEHRAAALIIESLTRTTCTYDGVVVACFYDPAVRELREALDIPVMGVGEAAMLVASGLGHRFTVLVGTQKSIPKMSDNALRYGMERRVASWRPIGVSVETLHEGPERAYQQALEAARLALDHDGAEVLILGCTALEGIAPKLQDDLGCPVIDPVAAGFKLVELLVDLRERVGISTSKVRDYSRKFAGDR